MFKTSSKKKTRAGMGARAGAAFPHNVPAPLMPSQVFDFVEQRLAVFGDLQQPMTSFGRSLTASDATYTTNAEMTKQMKWYASHEMPAARVAMEQLVEKHEQIESVRRETTLRMRVAHDRLERVRRESSTLHAHNLDRQNKLQRLIRLEEAIRHSQQTAGTTQSKKRYAPPGIDEVEGARVTYQGKHQTFRDTFVDNHAKQMQAVKTSFQDICYSQMFFHAKALESMSKAYAAIAEMDVTADNNLLRKYMDCVEFEDGGRDPMRQNGDRAGPRRRVDNNDGQTRDLLRPSDKDNGGSWQPMVRSPTKGGGYGVGI